jgi:cysteinyl-tRNA synthetase
VGGQGGITLIGEGGQRRFEAGASIPFDAFHSSGREVVTTFDAEHTIQGYAFSDDAEDTDGGPAAALAQRIEQLQGITGNEKIDLLALLHTLQEQAPEGGDATAESLVDLILELRAALREAKRFDLSDRARDVLAENGFEIQDTPQGSRWTRR